MAIPSVVAGFAKRMAKPGAGTCCLKRDLGRERDLCRVVLRWWAKLECLGCVCGGVARHIAKYCLTQLVCIAAGVFTEQVHNMLKRADYATNGEHKYITK